MSNNRDNGNDAAMRKVLAEFVHDFASFREDVEHGKLHMMQCMDFVKGFIPHMEAALSAQTRNCDVGAADEQYGRWKAFCGRHDKYCTGCPFDVEDNSSHAFCFAKWAQLPYKGKEKSNGSK